MLPSADYAQVLECLHAGLRQIDVPTPHFMDRVAATQQDVASRDVTPDLAETDRALLANTLRDLSETIVSRRAAEQILHSKPHPGNALKTKNGPLFTDFEDFVNRWPLLLLSPLPEESAAAGLCLGAAAAGAFVPVLDVVMKAQIAYFD